MTQEVPLEAGPHLPINPALYRACEVVGQAMELWGFKRVHGMVWMYIYLQPEAQSAHDVKEGLGISTGLTSMTLADLLRWGVVLRNSQPGDRRDYYTSEPNIWRPIMKVLREREYYQMGVTLSALREIQESLNEIPGGTERFAANRLGDLIQLGELAQRLFGQFLELGIFDMRDLRKLSLGAGLGQTILAIKRLLTGESAPDREK